MSWLSKSFREIEKQLGFHILFLDTLRQSLNRSMTKP